MSLPRTTLWGISASPGVAIGVARVLDRGHVSVPRRHVARDLLEFEKERLRDAIERSRLQLADIRTRLGHGAAAEYRLILDAHLMMHRDELLTNSALKCIEEEQINAEWALRRSVDAIQSHLARAADGYLRERAVDIEHVGTRILAQLVGRSSSLPPLKDDAILIVDDLQPADAAQLIRSPALAAVTGLGSATSHSAILLRTLGIPAVVGVRGVLRQVGEGDVVIVDALHGEVILNAGRDEQAHARDRARQYRRFTGRLRKRKTARTTTRDKMPIRLMANVELAVEAQMALDVGAGGIGLYRTEFLFLNRTTPPSEQEQAEVYTEVVRAMAGRPVVFRTFDAGGDALSLERRSEPFANPALGLRAIRLGLSRVEILRAQMRAVLRAACAGRVSLMFPLVGGLYELRRALEQLRIARAELEDAGTEGGEVRVGTMIELPSSVMMADQLARECDFFAVGTNDLVQYAMAVDRSDPRVAHLASSLDPAVLRMLKMTARGAQRRGIPLSMCGGMADDPLALPLAVGMGFRTLSVPVGSLPLTREIIRRIDSDDARKAARRALRCATPQEVEQLVLERFEAQLGDIWAEQDIERSEA